MENSLIQLVKKKVKEVSREYLAKGYDVIVNPAKSEIPDFLQNFRPDIIALKDQDNVIIEIKVSSSLNSQDFKNLENLANLIENEKNWRFELIFTNPRDIEDYLSENLLNDNQLVSRLEVSRSLVAQDLNIAFITLWTVFESISRRRIVKTESAVNKTILSQIKSLYSGGFINQLEYRKVENFFKLRNNIIHGFSENVNSSDFEELFSIILKLTGKSPYSFIYKWIHNQDLENYLEVYSLYHSVYYQRDYGLFKIKNQGETIYISSHNDDGELKINDTDQKDALLKFLSDEYMNGMDEETYYSLNHSMEKDD